MESRHFENQQNKNLSLLWLYLFVPNLALMWKTFQTSASARRISHHTAPSFEACQGRPHWIALWDPHC